jgi:hypothetical protein
MPEKCDESQVKESDSDRYEVRVSGHCRGGVNMCAVVHCDGVGVDRVRVNEHSTCEFRVEVCRTEVSGHRFCKCDANRVDGDVVGGRIDNRGGTHAHCAIGVNGNITRDWVDRGGGGFGWLGLQGGDRVGVCEPGIDRDGDGDGGHGIHRRGANGVGGGDGGSIDRDGVSGHSLRRHGGTRVNGRNRGRIDRDGVSGHCVCGRGANGVNCGIIGDGVDGYGVHGHGAGGDGDGVDGCGVCVHCSIRVNGRVTGSGIDGGGCGGVAGHGGTEA